MSIHRNGAAGVRGRDLGRLADRVKLETAARPSPPCGFVLLGEVSEHEGGGWLVRAPVKKLVDMVPPWNPRGRTDPEHESSRIKTLMKSMETYGLAQYPVVNNQHVIEGNRRVKAAFLLEWPTVTCLYRPWATASDYADYNYNQHGHTPVQKLESWLDNPSAVTFGDGTKLQRAANVLGMKTMRWACSKNRNVLASLQWAVRAFEYCQPPADRKAFLRKAVGVQIRYGEQKAMRDWIEQGRSPVVLAERIMGGRRLKPKDCG